ncbi:sulfurtransferase-like selenium metabolism protein YedF [Enterococcus sp. HY326]|uniref:sulfurtransferase-like selenium metabolism protein YedF n=1 Tax=Enterococcus sp. HY326 TaxID=2971265 RepID=UPI003A0FF4D8
MLGKPCPIPVIEAKKALQELGDEAGFVEVLVDNQVAVENIKKMAKGKHIPVEVTEISIEEFIILLKKPVSQVTESQETSEFVVIFGKQILGEGNPELGRMMMQSYIYSLTELPQAPTQLIFFHGGVFLTNQDSPVLEDLQKLANQGTQISTCGACLDFFDIKEQLAIGDITNMYTISLTLATAGKVISF